MKIATAKIDSFITSPGGDVTAALIYGPDFGLVSQRASRLIKAIIDDPSDPFRIAELSYNTIKDEPAVLGDEINALCFSGGRRLIKIRDSSTTLSKDVMDVLSESKSNTFVLFTAGDLAPSSSLRKFFEKEENVAAIPCYKDDNYSVQQVIETALRSRGFSWEPEALKLLSSNFLGDRLVVVSELEKLMLYMGDKKRIAITDVQAAIDDSAEVSLDALCNAVAGQNATGIDKNLQQAFLEGVAPVTILRAVGRYFMKLHLVKGLIRQGNSEQDAVAALRPPLFFKQVPPFKHHLALWSETKISRVLSALMELEAECKQTGTPAELLCARFLTILPLAKKG